MAAGYQNIYLNQGDTFTLQTTLTDDYGNPFNLNGYTVQSVGKQSYYSTSPSIIFTSTITDASNEVIQLSANSQVTANVPTIPVNKMVYDVIITDAQGNVTRVLEGQVIVSPGVTL